MYSRFFDSTVQVFVLRFANIVKECCIMEDQHLLSRKYSNA